MTSHPPALTSVMGSSPSSSGFLWGRLSTDKGKETSGKMRLCKKHGVQPERSSVGLDPSSATSWLCDPE